MKFLGVVKAKNGLRNFEAAKKSSREQLLKIVSQATLKVHEEAVRGVVTRSQGEKQVRYNPKRTVIASKPGDPPNVDRGIFLRSIQFEISRQDLTGYIGTNDERGPHFEFGTRTMSPRPWLGPAWKKSQKYIRELFSKFKLELK